MPFSPTLEKLIEALCCLPGVGPKSAQRMALHLLTRDRDNAKALADNVTRSLATVQHCERCRNLADTPICHICNNPRREQDSLCIVESPADVIAIEQTHVFRGLYFVLMGHLSPIDNIGPDALGMNLLQQRVQEIRFNEVIIATNPTVEGEATAHYIQQRLKPYVSQISRIAHGVPVGGELEYIDGGTLSKSLQRRELIEVHD